MNDAGESGPREEVRDTAPFQMPLSLERKAFFRTPRPVGT